MKIIDANKASLIVPMVRGAIGAIPKGAPAIARMHPAQECAYEKLGIHVSVVRKAPVAPLWKRVLSRLVLAKPPRVFLGDHPTMAGYRIIADTWMPPDRIRFEVNGDAVSAIVNLAVPPGYETTAFT